MSDSDSDSCSDWCPALDGLTSAFGSASSSSSSPLHSHESDDDNNILSKTMRAPPTPLISAAISSTLKTTWNDTGVVRLPSSLRCDPSLLQGWTDAILALGPGPDTADFSYETIDGHRVVTRLEQFVDAHPGWSHLCHGMLAHIVSSLHDAPWLLYKEKLNIKPPGGLGFAPHLDSPSLRVTGLASTFVTVMVAIDDMSLANGCLRLVPGPWSEALSVPVQKPEEGGDPDAGGRAGAIHSSIANELVFEPLEVRAGDVVVFNGWVPHRSSANSSDGPRRAVFLTYNPQEEGDQHVPYYEHMTQLRADWLRRHNEQLELDRQAELQALSTLPP